MSWKWSAFAIESSESSGEETCSSKTTTKLAYPNCCKWPGNNVTAMKLTRNSIATRAAVCWKRQRALATLCCTGWHSTSQMMSANCSTAPIECLLIELWIEQRVWWSRLPFRVLKYTDKSYLIFPRICFCFLHCGSGNTMQSAMTDVVEMKRLCNRIQWRSDMFREDYYQACLSKLLKVMKLTRNSTCHGWHHPMPKPTDAFPGRATGGHRNRPFMGTTGESFGSFFWAI